MAEVPIFGKLTTRNSAEKPSIFFSNSGSTASGVTSRPVKPVPPVVMITSITGSAIQPLMRARIASMSSATIERSATTWPAPRMRCTRSAPDLSSLIERVSETVSTAILSGMNFLVSSKPGMRQLQTRARRALLQRVRRQRIAGGDFAGVKAVHEPALALLRCAVGERVRHDVTLHLLLQAVVADGGGRLHGLIDVAGLEEGELGLLAIPLLPVRPQSGEAVSLQLDADLKPIRLSLARSRFLRVGDAGQYAQFILHMMADLVGDHVGLRELTSLAVGAPAELVLQIVKEGSVEIDALIVRAVEGPHGLFCEAAGARL